MCSRCHAEDKRNEASVTNKTAQHSTYSKTFVSRFLQDRQGGDNEMQHSFVSLHAQSGNECSA